MIVKEYKKYNEIVYKKTLSNGLEVILVPKRDFQKIFAVFSTNFGGMDLAFIPVGKKNKVIQPSGIAHFLEHVLFKMPGGIDAMQVFDDMGINSNAFTSHDKTGYLIRGTENFLEALEYLLDYVQMPYFTDKIVKTEQGIITEEINMYLDEPTMRIYNKLLENTYKNCYLKKDVIGTEEEIKRITKTDLYNAYYTFYHPSNMRLIVTGNFDVDEYLELIQNNQAKKTFKNIGSIKRFEPYEPKKVVVTEESEEGNVNIPLVGLSVKFEENKNLREQYIKALKLSMLLEYYFSNSGEIYEKLLDQELINRSFSYYINLHKSYLSFHIAGYTRKPEVLLNTLQTTLKNLKRRKANEERFKMIKRMNQGAFIKSINSVEGITYGYLDIATYGIDLFEYPKIINDVKLEDVFSLTAEINSDVITTYTINPKKSK
ncbi:MAG TPA: insulinase family protein [Acholeplasma sp.]|jgi:predicted Zn-dependent peptidase|nr:insulinase family protein [Acholeplasma sp.]